MHYSKLPCRLTLTFSSWQSSLCKLINTKTQRISKFLQRCCLGFRSSGVWRCVAGFLFPDVSKERNFLHTQGPVSQRPFTIKTLDPSIQPRDVRLYGNGIRNRELTVLKFYWSSLPPLSMYSNASSCYVKHVTRRLLAHSFPFINAALSCASVFTQVTSHF